MNIVCIYILEAHFVEKNNDGKIIDGWPIGSSYNYPQHKTINDRISMANKFITDFKWNIPTFVDTIENDFNKVYSAWPDRAYVIFNDRLIYISKINKDGSRNMTWVNEIEMILYDDK